MKRVHVFDPENFDHVFTKTLYFDAAARALYPDFCMVDTDGNVLWQSNSLRLRGPDVGKDDDICVVWGDSVVFGTYERSWPEILNDFGAGVTFLNGGIEGADYAGVLSRVIDFNGGHCVRLNVIMPGWHPVGDSALFAADLEAALRQIPRPVLVTMPTSLNQTMVDCDISEFLNPGGGNEVGFELWGAEPYSVQQQKRLFSHVTERNALVMRVAQKLGVPVVDLFTELDSRLCTDFRQDFFDVSHPRPATYPKIAAAVWKTLEPLLTASTDIEPKRTLR